jgi:hypothetical protein
VTTTIHLSAHQSIISASPLSFAQKSNHSFPPIIRWPHTVLKWPVVSIIACPCPLVIISRSNFPFPLEGNRQGRQSTGMQAGMTSSGGTDTGRTTEPSRVKQLHEVVITASQRRISIKSEATDVAVRDRERRKGTERTTEPRAA